MIFSSTLFLFAFLPLVLILYYLLLPVKSVAARNILLLAASLVFYAWGEPVVIMIMLLSIAVNYFCGLRLGFLRKKGRKGRGTLAFALVFNLGLLGVYKYANFLVYNMNTLFDLNLPPVAVALPIGISFYTFQILSYVMDVHDGKVEPQRNPLSLALYISFFPQLIAGPIVRYVDIQEQIRARKHSAALFAEGVRRFIIGLSKKVLIANTVAVFADMAFRRPDISAPMAWVGVIAYALQIYYDFSGYSDMAIGLGKMFGFTFLENFDHPYIATSIQNFWRRWHISLSSWFRDYLYIPLGGNRKGAARTYFNLFVVFSATGLWHGASWSFVVWGLFHGFLLMLERAFLGNALRGLPRFAGWMYAMVVVLVGWVFFRADTLASAFSYLRSMFTFSEGGLDLLLANLSLEFIIAFIAGIAGSAPLLSRLKRSLSAGRDPASRRGSAFRTVAGVASVACCMLLLLASIIFLTGSDFNPFLYFRF